MSRLYARRRSPVVTLFAAVLCTLACTPARGGHEPDSGSNATQRPASATNAFATPAALRREAGPTLRKTLGELTRIVNPRYDVDDAMGFPIAVSGTRALVSALDFDEATGEPFGIVFAFEFRDGRWYYGQTLHPPRRSAETAFGAALAIDGDIAVIGEPGGDAALPGQGFAVVYSLSGNRWQPQAELMAADGRQGDEFGSAVAVSGDSIVVGAFEAEAAGAAYVFVRDDGNAWTQQARLLAGDREQGAAFATAVALSGDTALIGAPHDSIDLRRGQGSAYAFVRSGGAWTQQAKFIAPDGADFDHFGRSVALDGDPAAPGGAPTRSKGDPNVTAVALIGAYGDDIGSNIDQGSAYAFVRNDATWSQSQKLINTDGTPADRSDEFAGWSVALAGNVALVGAFGMDGTDPSSGGAIVYGRSGNQWLRRDLLTNSRPDSRALGFAVALTPDFAFAATAFDHEAGNPERNGVQVWSRATPAWSETQRLYASTSSHDLFGHSIAVSDSTALIGAPGADVGGSESQGAVFVYGLGPSGWRLQARLTADDGAAGRLFGISVALDGTDTAYVGSANAATGALSGTGAVYVFERNASGWAQTAKLTTLDAEINDFFGAAIAIDGESLLVGAPGDTVGGVMRGSVVSFARQGGVWVEGAKLFEPDAVRADGYGWSLALAGDLLLVGAPALDALQARGGSAYLYERDGARWTRRQRFQATAPVLPDGFGFAVELGLANEGHGSDVAFFGAPLQEVDDVLGRGAVHVSTRGASGWGAPSQLASSTMGVTDALGWSLALGNGVLYAGAPITDTPASGPSPPGAVFRYQRTGSDWIEVAGIAPSDSPGAQFGRALAAHGSQLLIGAAFYSPPTAIERVGAVYFAAEAEDRLFVDGFESP
jgi:hypothetical protein